MTKKNLRSTVSSSLFGSGMPTYGPPLDYSFKELKVLREILTDEPVTGEVKTEECDDPSALASLNSVALRLSNNDFESLDGLIEVVEAVLDDPNRLMWLDVSHCKLTTIEPIILAFPNLSVLYLHGNQITSLSQINKLTQLPYLQKLTLHGNPVEEKPGYRLYTFSHLPNLRSLDFIGFTKVDRDRAMVWNREYQKKLAARA